VKGELGARELTHAATLAMVALVPFTILEATITGLLYENFSVVLQRMSVLGRGCRLRSHWSALELNGYCDYFSGL
jgi:hypothetical protein